MSIDASLHFVDFLEGDFRETLVKPSESPETSWMEDGGRVGIVILDLVQWAGMADVKMGESPLKALSVGEGILSIPSDATESTSSSSGGSWLDNSSIPDDESLRSSAKSCRELTEEF